MQFNARLLTLICLGNLGLIFQFLYAIKLQHLLAYAVKFSDRTFVFWNMKLFKSTISLHHYLLLMNKAKVNLSPFLSTMPIFTFTLAGREW